MNSTLGIIEKWISGRYRLSTKTIEWVHANMSPLDELRDTYQAMTYDIDDASYQQLDVIGALVKLPRLSAESKDIFWGWSGQSEFSRTWGQAPWYGAFPLEVTPIPDQLYRRAIKLKIIKNVSGGTYEESIISARELLQQDVRMVEDFINDSMYFEYETTLDEDTQTLINLYDLAIYPCTALFEGYKEKL